jgi:hypothetical protein
MSCKKFETDAVSRLLNREETINRREAKDAKSRGEYLVFIFSRSDYGLNKAFILIRIHLPSFLNPKKNPLCAPPRPSLLCGGSSFPYPFFFRISLDIIGILV